MRVLHYSSSFSPLSQTFLYDAIVALDRRGLEGHVATLARFLVDERPYPRVDVFRLVPKPHPLRVMAKLREVVRPTLPDYHWHLQRRWLRKVGRAVGPDVLFAHFGPNACVAAPVARSLRVPLVVAYHGYDASELLRQPDWVARYRQMWAQAAAVTVVSERMRARLASFGCPEAKLHVVHVGKRLEDFPYREPHERVRRLLSVGRLVEKKGHDDAIRAVAKARDAGHELTLDIVGDGPGRERLERLVAERGLEGSVRLLGALPHEEVVARMRESHALVQASRTAANGDEEGVPTVLMEAQMLGLPCVGTRHAGIPEVFPVENHGLLAGEGDSDDLADKLAHLAALSVDELRAIAARGREHVARAFNLDVETDKLAELLRGVVRRRPGGVG